MRSMLEAAGMTANSIYIYIQETLFETDKNIGACALTGRPANPHTPRLPAQECLWEEPMKHENKRQQYQAGYYKTHPCRDSFPCRVCGRLVTPEGAGSSHRNHCPNCLCSLHVDITPGDRAADCYDPQMKNGRRSVSFGASAVFRVKNRYDGITREMRSTQRAHISDRSPVSLYNYPGHRLRSPFEWLRVDCMLPEPANDVFFFVFH